MVDIDTAIQRLEKALGTLKDAKVLLGAATNGAQPVKNHISHKPASGKLIAEMRRLRAKGLSYREIGLKVGKHLTTVHSHLNK